MELFGEKERGERLSQQHFERVSKEVVEKEKEELEKKGVIIT